MEEFLNSSTRLQWLPAQLLKVCRVETKNAEPTPESWAEMEKRRERLRAGKESSAEQKFSVIIEPYTKTDEPDDDDSMTDESLEADHPFIQINPKALQIFADNRINKNSKQPPAGSRIDEDNFSDIMKIIKEQGIKRDMMQIKLDQHDALIYALDNLAKEMPNFSDVVEHIKNNLLFACHGDRNVYFPPILLAGPPGIGKTLFASKLAKVLRLPYHYLAMENKIGNGTLVGTQAMYNNSRPGLLYNLLIKGDIANPLILLDEIEKAGSDSRHGGSVINQLLSLLEKNSAQRFEDQSIEGLAFDASWINWVLTANDLSLLPEPMISRSTLFDIQPPKEDQLPHIIHSIYQQLLNERCVVAEKRLPIADTAMTGLASLISNGDKGLRDLRSMLQNALIKALNDGQTEIGKAQLGIDTIAEKNKERLKIGFL
jgi:ATP-dependent Lon protease